MRTLRRYEITRYEIVARHADGRAWLVGYSPRLSRSGLLAAMRDVGDQIIERLDCSETDQITFKTKPRPSATLTNGATIRFTGRTQREVRQAGGELRWIAGCDPKTVVSTQTLTPTADGRGWIAGPPVQVVP